MPETPNLPPIQPHCRDFSRAEILRQSAAVAGRGLPAIEPGMPTPAGTGLSRRAFMARSAGLALTVFGASALSPDHYEYGLQKAMAAAGADRVLTSIYMTGALDGLSVPATVNDSPYHQLRPPLAVPDSGNPLDIF